MTILTPEDGYRLQQQNYDLKTEVDRLGRALQNYGEHRVDCKALFTKDHADCDCGWKSVLDTLNA